MVWLHVMESSYYVYDRSFPAYYYPAVIFLNSPSSTEPIKYRNACLRALKMYVTSDVQLTAFEFEQATLFIYGSELDEKIWGNVLQHLQHWKLGNKSEFAVPHWMIEKILIMGMIAPF